MALSDDIITRLTAFEVLPGNFSTNTPNLPIQIAIQAEANDDFQSIIDPTTPVQVTNIQEVAALAGWGSPIYQAAKEIFIGNQGIPVFIYPQAKAIGATPKVMHVACTGTASNNGTHYVTIAGRNNVGGQSYSIGILQGDTSTIIHQKITDTVNNVLGSPMKASNYGYYSSLQSKHSGLTAQDITVSVDTNGNDLNLSYAVTTYSSGAGTPDVSASLALFGNRWITHVINGYGLVTSIMNQYESFNGVPVIGSNPSTGRYLPTVFKPFFAFSGFVSETVGTITDTHLNQVTLVTCPAPLSKGLPIEAAANYCLLHALCMQNTPHLDIIGQSYPDMPTPNAIGAMASWEQRNIQVKEGSSTVDLVGGRYQIQDPVTTYHPVGEIPPQFRYIRNLGIDWNTRFTYMILEGLFVLDHVIYNDSDVPGVDKFVQPKSWKSKLSQMAKDMVTRGLWVDAQFTIDSIRVSISTVNPDRFKTSFSYKRSGVVRQSDTEATAGFNVGTLEIN